MVEMGDIVPLMGEVSIEMAREHTSEQKIRYEFLSKYYRKSSITGHLCKNAKVGSKGISYSSSGY